MKKIVFPEGNDPRILEAAKVLITEAACHPVLIGDEAEITNALGEGEYSVVAPDDSDNAVWQGGSMVADDQADGIVAGAVFSTPDVLRAYIKTIGTAEGVARMSSCFLMEKGQERYLFADCGVNIDPSSEVMAETAYLTAQFAPLLDIDPKIAFLSFSTKGSASHEVVDKVTEALRITKERWPDLVVDGELQIDAAIVPEVAASKAPDSPLKGQATVLIFPNLDAGNMAYKLVERLGGFSATGPLLLGFAKPAHDLSRGCSAADIVNAAKIALKQSS